MPTFTVIALDRLLEPGGPGASKSVDMSLPNSNSNSISNSNSNSKSVSNSMPVRESNSKLERRRSTPLMDKRLNRMTPALYATPQATPLPDSPTSFTPSPYIINHKRRGPRLLKSYSEQDVSLHQKAGDEEKVNGDVKNDEAKVAENSSANDDSCTFTFPSPIEVNYVNGVHHCESSNGNLGASTGQLRSSNVELSSSSASNGSAREDDLKPAATNSERDSDRDDFFEPKDSMSVASNTDGEVNAGTERSAQNKTPMGEFYDAWEELSSESGQGQQLSACDYEAEWREMRLSLLMEIEKRKQAEESLNNLRSQWQRIREHLSLVGLTLPVDPTFATVNEQQDSDPAEELCQQVYLARFVSNSIGRGIARAEMEKEIEAQIESKNFEIARLWDKLRNYEAMNQEMVQRNQDVFEMARRERERREQRQRWVWGSIAAALSLGTAALAYSYFPSGRGSATYHSEAPEVHDAGK